MSGPVGGSGGGDSDNFVTIWQFGGLVPPTGKVELKSSQGFDFEIYGAGVPFKMYGNDSGNTSVWIGWAGAYVHVKVRSPAIVSCTFWFA